MTKIKFAMSVDIEDPKAVKACAAFFAALAECETPIGDLTIPFKKKTSKKSTDTEIKKAEKVDPTVATKKIEPETEAETFNISVDQVRKLVAEKAKKHKTEIRTMLTELKAANVTKLDSKHYENFMEFLTDLK